MGVRKEICRKVDLICCLGKGEEKIREELDKGGQKQRGSGNKGGRSGKRKGKEGF